MKNYYKISVIFALILSVLCLNTNAETEVADDTIAVVVFLKQSMTTHPVQSSPIAVKRHDKIKSILSSINKQTIDRNSHLFDFIRSNKIEILQEHKIVPALTIKIASDQLDELKSIYGVKNVVENLPLTFMSPVKEMPAPMTASTAISSELSKLGISSLWQLGLKGKGRLICSFDTGVDYDHPSLKNKWRGNRTATSSAWFSKTDPNGMPHDATGHGTHTMGLMVGASEADSFGVAPEAEWISAGVVDQGRSLPMTLSDILDAFEWVLNPDGDSMTTDDVPDVILNSWGIPKGLFEPCDNSFNDVIDVVEAAGIVTVFACGNEGPDRMTIRYPADISTSPTNSFSVGAVDNNMVIAEFSSRGPSSCDTTMVKPELVAYGVSIRSAKKGGGYSNMSGTSMAAPYIAGAVALIRQYNPEATVDEIKTALINSTVDLGELGKDNAYGHGLVDLSQVLNYIPAPVSSEMALTSIDILGDGYAFPGDKFDLRLKINNPKNDISQFVGSIESSNNDSVTIHTDSVIFIFNSSNEAINLIPFELSFPVENYNGQLIDFKLLLKNNLAGFYDSLYFTLEVGVAPHGNIITHHTDNLNLTVSNFGQLGFAPGSIYNLNGDGFNFNNSSNLLYESGLVVARNAVQLSKSIRNEQGRYRISDFVPLEALSQASLPSNSGLTSRAVFKDENSPAPLPLDITQTATTYNDYNNNGFCLLQYELTNYSQEYLENVAIGLLNDFDLSPSDRVTIKTADQIIYQQSSDGMLVGMQALALPMNFKVLSNDSIKVGFDNHRLFEIISSLTANPDSSRGDKMFMATVPSINIRPGETVTLAIALAGGETLGELENNLNEAVNHYDIATAIENNNQSTNLPNTITLHQNYPNPFNPTTTISFTLPEKAELSLEIFNILGQKVRTLFDGEMGQGLNAVEWDGNDDSNSACASGVYFYRLLSENIQISKKMSLIK